MEQLTLPILPILLVAGVLLYVLLSHFGTMRRRRLIEGYEARYGSMDQPTPAYAYSNSDHDFQYVGRTSVFCRRCGKGFNPVIGMNMELLDQLCIPR